MKPELGDKQRLLHIRDAILLIEQFLETLDEMHFQQSALHRSAIERQLEIIGEAANAISETLKNNHPEVEWQPIRRFRNVIVHEYFGVSTQIIWTLVKKELPLLKIQIDSILKEVDPTPGQ
jgi:uncharacterized protein with HEPN domain